MDPHVVRLIHRLDQLGEDVKPLARFLATYHRTLVEAGFTRAEALRLVEQWQAVMLAPLVEQPGKRGDGPLS